MHVQLLRRISGLNAAPGEIVDASDWAPNRVQSLIKQRRCVPVMVAPAPTTTRKGTDEARHSR